MAHPDMTCDFGEDLSLLLSQYKWAGMANSRHTVSVLYVLKHDSDLAQGLSFVPFMLDVILGTIIKQKVDCEFHNLHHAILRRSLSDIHMILGHGPFRVVSPE